MHIAAAAATYAARRWLTTSIQVARSRGRKTTASEMARRDTVIAVAAMAPKALRQTGRFGGPEIRRKAQMPIAANAAKRTISNAHCQRAHGRRVAAARATPRA